MILTQQFLPVHTYGNPTDKNLAKNFSSNRYLCDGGLKFQPSRFSIPGLIRELLLYTEMRLIYFVGAFASWLVHLKLGNLQAKEIRER